MTPPTPQAARFRLWQECAVVIIGFALLTIAMTAPLALHLGTLARVDNGDGQFSVWNVAWVARSLVLDPIHVFDANIFYPRRWTLAFSETNLGAGTLAVPVYWTTGNVYVAHNVVLLMSFVLSATGTCFLVRYLTGDWRAGFASGICFAYCPYVFAHVPHIQLLMTAGLPVSMLALHRLADHPTPGRGAALGLAMGAQALFCGYYAVFVALAIGFASLLLAATRRAWTSVRYWIALAAAAAVAMALAVPLLLPYLAIPRSAGFARSLDAARQYSADWRAYLASSSYAHAWALAILRDWKEVLFPGLVATLLGAAGLLVGWKDGGRQRETALLYGSLALLACWASFGPGAGLYTALYALLTPVFRLLHAPSRFGLVVAFALAVLAGIGLSEVLRRSSRPALVAAAVIVAAVAELRTAPSFTPVPPVEPAYRVLANLPRGAVLEVPVYSTQFAFLRTRYMLDSTVHWMPLVNGYSDYVPADFIEETPLLGDFPSLEAFKILRRDSVKYAVFHMDVLRSEIRDDLVERLRQFDRYLVRRYADDRVWLYEIVGFPP